MKLTVRLYFFPQERAPLLADPVISREIDLAEPFWVDTESEIFLRLLSLGAIGQGAQPSFEVECTEKELTQVRAFQPLCRKLVRETDEDRALNFARIRNPPPGNEEFPSQRIDRIVLSRVDLPPNAVGGVETCGVEYVLGGAAAQAFHDFSGFEPRPIYQPSGETHRGATQLYTSRTMPPCVRDRTLLARRNPAPLPSAFAQLGCLSYAPPALDAMADFNRTMEPLTGNWLADWIVSARVRARFKERKLKGWAFRPVLEAGSALHREYLEKWERLRGRMEQHGAARVMR
jgi:hypothetical protein